MRRSEIWLISLDPTIGAEIKKTRPVVVVSIDELGNLPLKVIAPLTDWKTHYTEVPWMVQVQPNQKNGLAKPSAVDTFQVRSVAQERFICQLGVLDADTMHSVTSALAEVLGLD